MTVGKTNRKRIVVAASFILAFCILGATMFSVVTRVSREMSAAAIDNLSESLDLIKGTIEAMLNKEAEFQKLIAQELALTDMPEELIRSYASNRTMVKLSLITAGETEGISNTGETFSPEELDFSRGNTVVEMDVSRSYLNSMGTWAYTMRCPVVKDNEEIGTLYIEYIYDSFEDALPRSFYNDSATLYAMDADSRRMVLRPKGIGNRVAGHLDLEDFYRSNNIMEEDIKREVNRSIESGENVMFYHDVQNEASLIYMWAVNDGTIYLIGYVPVGAIQREGSAVNQNIFMMVAVMVTTFLICCTVYFFMDRQQNKVRKEQEKEREIHSKQLSEALQAAQIASSSKTMFLSNMSHDIRTPMNAILGFATLLEKDAEYPEKVREYTGKITASGRHLLGLINDVLDVSKIESGKVVLNIGEFDIKEMAASVDSIIRPAARARNQNFNIVMTGVRQERLLGDETRINQILLNLLSNAVKYTQEGGNIWLRITGLERRSSQFEHIKIEVEDDGYGMTPEYLEVIFDAFTRAENSTTNKVQGTGLGMAITKNIVELMGGTIKVASQVDKGSLFTVELELRIPEEGDSSAGQVSVEIPEAGSLKGLRFLVAEDNEINAEILSELLGMEGAECRVVENGKLAVETFENAQAGTYDAILMDVQMPVMNGYEATRIIRGLDREDGGSIPIIAMTANAFAEDVKDALDAGMNAHVSKPIDMEMLKRTVCSCVAGGKEEEKNNLR